MKKLFCVIVLLIFTANVFSQDTILFHNGDVCKCKVHEVSSERVLFSYINEEAINVIGCNAIAEIQYASGRVQHVSEKIEINSVDDWEKVKVVYDKEEVKGLKSLGKIEKHSNGAWSFHNTTGHFMKKAMMKAQKEAAKKGACILLIVNQSNTARAGFSSYSDSSIICEMFTYK